MNCDFIEIGTSDFDTLLQNSNDENEIGLSIDPIIYYLNELPNKKNKYKLNYAISNRECMVDVYWVYPTDIVKYDLPYWLRGCNSIISPHPTTINELNQRNLQHILQKTKCECITWETLIKKYNIKSVHRLKVDTEGHDCIIIDSILDSEVLPKIMSFEVNKLTNKNSLNQLYKKLNMKGFKQTQNTGHDVTFQI